MSRETLKSFLNANGYSSQEISYVVSDDNGDGQLNQGDDDLGVDPGTGRELLDLDGTTRGLLGDYLKYVTDNVDTFFPFRGGNSTAPSSERGSSIQPAQNSSAEIVFAPSDGSGVNTNYSNSGYFDSTTRPLDTIINKVNGVDGNTLLPDVKGAPIDTLGSVFVATPEEDTGKLGKPINQVLRNFNRFNPTQLLGGKVFVDRGSTAQDLDNTKYTTAQRDFGDYDKTATGISLEQLKSVAGSMLLKAAGWDDGDNPTQSVSPDADFSPAGARGTLDREIYTYRLTPDRAYGAPTTEQGGSTRAGRGSYVSSDLSADSSKSYGSVTTPDSPFYSSNSNVILAQAAAAISLMIAKVEEAIPKVLDYISNAENVNRGAGPYPKGYSTRVGKLAKYEFIKRTVFIPTIYPYSDCVRAGLKIMFSGSDNFAGKQGVYESPGFWLSIARSVLRSTDIVASAIYTAGKDAAGVDDKDKIRKVLDAISRSKVIGLMNAAATSGDILLRLTKGSSNLADLNSTPLDYDVDTIPDGPATRVSKSRSRNGTNSTALAWRNGSVPSVFALSRGALDASARMNSIVTGPSPAKAMLAGTLYEKTYVDRGFDVYVNKGVNNSVRRIPKEVVKILEDRLDAEYVPFYFHDLRTNEIIGLHAFLDTLSDSYSPSFNGTRGFGRIDDVQIYSKTSRTLGINFRMVATSKEDFNEMWFKINKLTTLVYPQWTVGTAVGDGQNTRRFMQPFSQVIGSSPIIRVRIGDVIKSNYSRFNLARIFGIGSGAEVNITAKAAAATGIGGAVTDATDFLDAAGAELFYGIMGSPFQYTTSDSTPGPLKQVVNSVASNFLIGGFANPLGYALVRRVFDDPDSTPDADVPAGAAAGLAEDALSGFSDFVDGLLTGGGRVPSKGLATNSFCYVKASNGRLYDFADIDYKSSGVSKDRLRLVRPVRCVVRNVQTDFPQDPKLTNEGIPQRGFYDARSKRKTYYTVMIIDPGVSYNLFMREIIVTHADVMPDPLIAWSAAAALYSPVAVVADIANAAARSAAASAGVDLSNTNALNILRSKEQEFMDPDENPFTSAAESAMGRGLAAVITSLSYNWIGSDAGMWETDWNSRAPMSCKVSMNLTVIHDIAPGIDAAGMNRAPVYNVGDTMHTFSGDPYPDNGEISKTFFTSAGSQASRRRN